MIHKPVSMVLQCGAGALLYGWLAEISTDLREAVAHLMRVRYDVLYKSTVTYLLSSKDAQCVNLEKLTFRFS